MLPGRTLDEPDPAPRRDARAVRSRLAGFAAIAGDEHVQTSERTSPVDRPDDWDESRSGPPGLVEVLVRDGAAEGYGEYRAHVDFMDLIAEQYDFNDGAMGRFNARIKGALDPQGILSPGKQGIWPAEAPWSAPSANGSSAPERVHGR